MREWATTEDWLVKKGHEREWQDLRWEKLAGDRTPRSATSDRLRGLDFIV